MELENLAKKIIVCKKCRLWKTRNKAVPGEGPKNAKIMFIGQAPGSEENKTGKPFVGRAGRFLDSLLKKNKINRKKIFITSIIKCFPPKNRVPKRDELKACKSYILKQIRLINPKVVVLFGNIAKTLINEQMLKNKKIIATYHPAAGMRFPKIRKKIEHDFKRIMPCGK